MTFKRPVKYRAPNLFGEKIDALSILVYILVVILFVFPQFPLRVRYLIPIGFLALLRYRQLLDFKPFLAFSAYTVYTICAGVFFVAFYNDGELADAFFPIKSLIVVALIVAYLPNLPVIYLAGLFSLWIGLQSIATIYDHTRGPIWQALPFPIFEKQHIFYLAGNTYASERYGGFTFESSVLGGMTGIMLGLILVYLYCIIFRRWNARLVLQLMVVLITVTAAMGIMFFTKTKTSYLTLASFGTGFLLVLLFQKNRNFLRQKLLGSALIVLVAVIAIVIVGVSKKTSYGDYIENELTNLYRLKTHGFSQTDGEGLNVRIEYAKIGYYGLFHNPWGTGMTNGYVYASPVLNKIEPPPEMLFFFNQGNYAGYKSHFFNTAQIGGVIGISMIIYLLYGLISYSSMPQFPELKIAMSGVAFALLAFCIMGELWPFWEFVFLAHAFGISIRRHVNNKDNERSMLESRVTH